MRLEDLKRSASEQTDEEALRELKEGWKEGFNRKTSFPRCPQCQRRVPPHSFNSHAARCVAVANEVEVEAAAASETAAGPARAWRSPMEEQADSEAEWRAAFRAATAARFQAAAAAASSHGPGPGPGPGPGRWGKSQDDGRAWWERPTAGPTSSTPQSRRWQAGGSVPGTGRPPAPGRGSSSTANSGSASRATGKPPSAQAKPGATGPRPKAASGGPGAGARASSTRAGGTAAGGAARLPGAAAVALPQARPPRWTWQQLTERLDSVSQLKHISVRDVPQPDAASLRSMLAACATDDERRQLLRRLLLFYHADKFMTRHQDQLQPGVEDGVKEQLNRMTELLCQLRS